MPGRRRRPVYLDVHLPGMSRRTRLLIVLTVLLSILAAVTIRSIAYFRELSRQMVVSDATDLMTLCINDTISRKFAGEDYGYDYFVDIVYDSAGAAVAVRQVCHVAVSCGACSCQVGDGMAAAQIPVTIKALYLDENDAVLLAEKNILVKGELEAGEGSLPHITLRCPGEITGAPSPEGMEIRFTLEFWMDTGRQIQKLCIADASLEEAEPGAQRQPSVILRKFDRGLRLWDIAKQYRTTCADILSANQVESEQTIPTDKLLLIPRRKA